jgi:hypothetical protein
MYTKEDLLSSGIGVTDPVLLHCIGWTLMTQYGNQLDEDELQFVVVHFQNPISSRAARTLLQEDFANLVTLGLIAKHHPELEGEAWEQVQRRFPNKKDEFLSFCPELRRKIHQQQKSRLAA